MARIKMPEGMINIKLTGRGRLFLRGKLGEGKIASPRDAVFLLSGLYPILELEDAEAEFPPSKVQVESDGGGRTHYRLRQYFRCVPVAGHELVLSVDPRGFADTLTGKYISIPKQQLARITREEAVAAAARVCRNIISTGELAYLVDEAEQPVLCYMVDTESYRIFVDAVTGKILDRQPALIEGETSHPAGQDPVSEDGSGDREEAFLPRETAYFPGEREEARRLWDLRRNIMVTDGQEGDRVGTPMSVRLWTGTPEERLRQRRALIAYNNMIRAHDYYHHVLGRCGADGRGRAVQVMVNYDRPLRDNACFAANREYTDIRFGSGRSYARVPDVMAHEFTHAVSDGIWGPVCRGETGALNEAYADILAGCIQEAAPAEEGEDRESVWNRFADPHALGYPAEYGEMRLCAPGTEEKNDHGYVHTNCAVLSHVAYKIRQRWPDSCGAYELATLFYRSMHKLGPDSGFAEAECALIATAQEMNLSHQKLGILVDAFEEAEISCRVNAVYSRNMRQGLVLDNQGNPMPGVLVQFISADHGDRVSPRVIGQDYTDSKGHYWCYLYENSQDYHITYYRLGYQTVTHRQTVGVSTAYLATVIMQKDPEFRKDYYPIRGIIYHPDTRNPLPGATVRIRREGKQEDRPGEWEVVLTTDGNGYYYTSALPAGVYQVRVTFSINSQTHCLARTFTLNSATSGVVGYYLRKERRSFVTHVHLETEEELSLSCETGSEDSPVTNLLLFVSREAETWTTRTLTYKNRTALYTRLEGNLNRGCDGRYLYLCYTRDPVYRPLTEAYLGERKAENDPFRSIVRPVQCTGDPGACGEVPDGCRGCGVTLFQSRHENL